MVRLIAADMDDTLLDSRGLLPEACVSSLKRAMDKGVRVVLASGRMLPAMTKYEEEIGVNAPMILFNGALTCENFTHRPIHEKKVPRGMARAIAKETEKRGIYLQAYTVDRFVCREVTDRTRAYEASVGVKGTPVHEELSGYIDFDPYKLLAIADPRDILSLQEALSGMFADTMNFMLSKPHYLEMVPKGTDKGEALAALAAHLGIAREDTAAFGDGQNDISMLKWAGRGYAMAGSRAASAPGVLAAPSSDEAGVAKVVDRLLAEG